MSIATETNEVNRKVKRQYLFIVLIVLVMLPWFLRGDMPQRVEQDSLLDITTLTSITERQFLYGALKDFPHTFEFTLTEPVEFSAEIFSPKQEEEKYVLSAILVKERSARGGVEEIARLEGSKASWNPFWHTVTGNRLHQGPTFLRILEPGTYRFEVHTPNNLEPYILVIGKQPHSWTPLPEAFRRIADFNAFIPSGSPLILSVYGYVSFVSFAGILLILYTLLIRNKKRV